MSTDKIGQWVDRFLGIPNNPDSSARLVEELTQAPITFTEEDLATYLKNHHSKAPVKIKLEDGLAKIKVGYSIFRLTFVCSVEADPSGKIVHLHLKKTPLGFGKLAKRYQGQLQQLGFLNYSQDSKTISCDLTRIPRVAHLIKDIKLKTFKININAVEIKFEKDSGAGGLVKGAGVAPSLTKRRRVS